MSEEVHTMGLEAEIAPPLHLQRLERSLNVQPFLNQINELFHERVSDDDKSDDSETSNESEDYLNDVVTRKEDERIDKLRLYNMSSVGEERRWLQDILLSDSSDSSVSESDTEGPITEDDFQDMLKFHILRKKYQGRFYQKPENIQYQYYGAGLLSSYDKFPEHQKLIIGNKKKKEKKPDKRLMKFKKEKTVRHRVPNEYQEHDYPEEDWERVAPKEDELDEAEINALIQHQPRQRGRKKHNNKSPEVMAMRRRKIWIMMSKKELGKVQRAKTNNHKEMLISCKKVAQHCMKYWRQKAMQSQKNMKETIWRAKRLTREMQSYWKRYDRVERETRRRLEKEAEEQRKMDVELIEAKRQQRKLNFLITQTELYAHFMSRKLGKASPEEQLRILNQLDEEKNPRLIGIDDYDSELMKHKAKKNAVDAFDSERARTRQFDTAAAAQELRLSDTPETLEHPQPGIFKGNLKGYQMKGMNWLANLYDQGISGILADEMGLGKTVQSIAFLCHVAEKYSVWGPFLIISPASTLHNWQQEMARFVPDFKVVPYWGNPQERKILRQFWETKDLHTKEASFHVVITSYQLVITDYKYFNRIKWQYMILDEAQAIKSTSSMRWKLLLGFSCRNRLLLSGTPIQNSMAELWALLHFIMPTLFDSHDEFNEWFSKDIESHAENKTGIDEKHLSRLHMILKPFMLRRIKKDVENELSDKIEIMVYCPLTTRQKLLYMALKKKIRIEDLLHYTVGGADAAPNDKNFTSNLMNLVMQFRKVCNHPELFERRDARSPLFLNVDSYAMPALLYNEGMIDSSLPSKDHLLYNKFCIFATEYMNQSLHHESNNSSFSFTRMIDLSPMEFNKIFIAGILFRWAYTMAMEKRMRVKRYWEDWWVDDKKIPQTSLTLLVSPKLDNNSEVIKELIFTKDIASGEAFYTHTTHTIHSMPETVAHRILRSSKQLASQLMKWPLMSLKTEHGEDTKLPLLPEHPHTPQPPTIRLFQRTTLPAFVCDNNPKIQASPRKLYVSSSSAACAWRRHEECGGIIGQRMLWLGCERAILYPPHTTSMGSRLAIPCTFSYNAPGGLLACSPINGWSNIIIPDKQTLVTDAGKLSVLDSLLRRLKEQGHRVLIYSQMTKMIDLLEEYMYHRKHTFMRLDGSSKISDRRDMVADFQKRADIFVFLLSTRAGGLGINLTAADTVIFYDSDWNPTVDQQAMDRAHRLGQTKQVTVYRLICKGTIEERILQRAREKSEIQRMVISGGNFKPDTLKPKEVVSLLLDDEEIEAKYSQRSEERKQHMEEIGNSESSQSHNQTQSQSQSQNQSQSQTQNQTQSQSQSQSQNQNQNQKERDRKRKLTPLPVKNDSKKLCLEDGVTCEEVVSDVFDDSAPASPARSEVSQGSAYLPQDDTSNEGLVVDVDGPVQNTINQSQSHSNLSSTSNVTQGQSGGPDPPKVSRLSHHFTFGSAASTRAVRPAGRGTNKRGRPRGSRRGGPVGGKGRGLLLLQPPAQATTPQGDGAQNITSVQQTPHGGPVQIAMREDTRLDTTTANIPDDPRRSECSLSLSDHRRTQNPYSSKSYLSGSTVPVPADGDGPSTVGPLGPVAPLMTRGGGGATVRRGPGRPRLRPSGPGNQGNRGHGSHHHGKRSQRPLPVPLRSHQLATLNPRTTSAPSSSSAQTLTSSESSKPFGFYTQQQQTPPRGS